MGQPEADIHDLDVHELLDAREQYLLLQIKKLRAHISSVQTTLTQRESELIQVRRAKIAAGDVDAFNEHCGPEASAAQKKFDELAIRALAVVIRETPPAVLPIKALIVRALIEGPNGGRSPAELKEKIETDYGRTIEAGSIRPNLGRLREDGIVVRSIPPKWMLDSRASAIMGAAYASDPRPADLGDPPPPGWFDDPFIKAVQAAAWKPEDDDQPDQQPAKAKAKR